MTCDHELLTPEPGPGPSPDHVAYPDLHPSVALTNEGMHLNTSMTSPTCSLGGQLLR